MKKRLLNIILVLLTLSLSSCASLFNSPLTQTKVILSEPSKLTINGEENNNIVDQKEIFILRSNAPLKIKAESVANKKEISVEAKNSLMYWSNLLFSSWIGMLIDNNNPKRYDYPKTIYIDLKDSLQTSQAYRTYDKKYDLLKNQIKFTPLKLIGSFNSGLEVAYERKTSKKFSTQFMGSLLFNSLVLKNEKSPTSLEGFRASIEQKYFYNESALIGPYLSFEVNYMQKKYYDTRNFGDIPADYDPYLDPNYDKVKYYSDNFGINKKTLSFNFKWGYQTIINQLVIDAYVGIGPRYRDVRHFDRINPNDEIQGTDGDLDISRIGILEAKEWSLSIPLNVKVGWAF
jgi:hypothetical protein